MDIQTTLVFNIKNLSKRDIKTPTIFCFSKSHQNMRNYISFQSKLHPKNKPKQRWFFIHGNQVEKSTSKRRRYFGHRSYAKQSTSKWRRFFAHRNYIEKSTSKWRGNLPIFSFRRIDVISTLNRCWLDVVCPLRSRLN